VSSDFVQILFVDDALTEIDRICRGLKNAGFLVQARSTTRSLEIRRILESQPPDLILASLEPRKPSLTHITKMIVQSGRDIPLLALHHGHGTEHRLTAIQAGARDMLSTQDPELLTLVVRRELDDLAARRKSRGSEARALEAEQRCGVLLDSTREAVAYVHEGAHIHVNDTYLRLFGFHQADELTALPLMNLIVPEDRDGLKTVLRRFVHGGDAPECVDLSGLGPHGRRLSLTLELRKATLNREPCAQVLVRDRTADRTLGERDAEAPNAEHLTGLASRAHFQARLEGLHRACRAQVATAALVYVSIDHHRTVCDKHGHEAGDAFLTDLGRALQMVLGPGDLMSRLTGAEFALMVHVGSVEDAKGVARTILATIEQRRFHFGREHVSTSGHIGIAMLGEDRTDPAGIMRAAHRTCNELRTGRGSRIAVSETASESVSPQSRIELADAIDEAIGGGRATLTYQAIASLAGGSAERYETRIWIRNDLGRRCKPEELFPAAGLLGLNQTFDCWVVRRVGKVLGKALEQGRRLSVFVPISADSILDSEFEQIVGKALPFGHGLVLQIDEEVAEAYFRRTLQFVRNVRKLGCAVAIAEFGGRHNSERLMRHLKPEYVKFRPSMIERMRLDSYTRKYVDAVTEEIRTLGGEAVASEVSDARQIANLWQSRFTLVQGNFVHSPSDRMSFDFANALPWMRGRREIA
jgi:diguanylate cyclase (GGDEF)-like protein